MFADIATRFFRDRWPIEATRTQIETEDGFDRALWAEIADLGWTGIAIPEEHGGVGLELAELVPIVEPMGRHLYGGPFVATQLAVQALVAGGDAEQQQAWLPRIAEGAIATVATVEADGSWELESGEATAEAAGNGWRLAGEKCFVLDAAAAELVVVTVSVDGAPAVALISSDRIPKSALEREIVVDETRRSYRFALDDVTVDAGALIRGDAAARAILAIRDAALLLVSAEACGGIAGTLELVVSYLGSRRQFDRLIGSYQALKHPTVDILIGLERARSHLYHAATVIGKPGAEVALRMAKAESSDAFAFAGDRAIQFHGGFGFTYECDAQLFLRRALWCQYQYGDAHHQRRHLAPLLLE